MDAEIVPAVDGLSLTRDQCAKLYVRQRFRPRYPFELCATEIGAFASHRAAWKRIVEDDLDYGFVFEDDAVVDADVIRALMDVLSECNDCVTYGLLQAENFAVGEKVAGFGQFSIIRPSAPPLRAIGQIVAQPAARRLLACTEPFDRPVDTFLQMTWVTGQPIHIISPSGVQDASPRTGGTTVGRKKLSTVQKVHHELMRPIYRARVRTLWRRHTSKLADQ